MINKKIYEIWGCNPQLTNQEKADLLNDILDKNWTPRAYQQRYSHYKDGVKAGIEKNATKKQLERIARAELNVDKKRKISALKRHQLNKDLKASTIKEVAIEEIKKYLGEDVVTKRDKKRTTTSKNGMIEYIVSDVQFDSHKVSINGFGKYERIISQDIANLNPDVVKNIRLSFCGDEIEGISAHKSQLLQVKEGAVQQTIQFSKLATKMINNLHERFPQFNWEVVFVPSSNHGETRPFNTKRGEFPKEDFGYIIQEFFKLGLNKEIYLYKDIFGVVYTANDIYLHGHQPYANSKNGIINKFGKAKNVFMGHFHATKFSPLGKYTKLIVAPTVMQTGRDYAKQAGYDEYSAILKVFRKGKRVIGVMEFEV